MPPLRSSPDSGSETHPLHSQTFNPISAQKTPPPKISRHARQGEPSVLDLRVLTTANHDLSFLPPSLRPDIRNDARRNGQATRDFQPLVRGKKRSTTFPQHQKPVRDDATDSPILFEASQYEVTGPAAISSRNHHHNYDTGLPLGEGEIELTEQELKFVTSLNDSLTIHFLKFACEYLGGFQRVFIGTVGIRELL